MRLLALAVVVGFTLAGCTSAIFGEETLSQVDRAKVLEVEVELQNAARAEEAYFAQNGSYTTDPAALGLNPPEDVALVITQLSVAEYCVQATHQDLGDVVYHVSKTDPVPTEGAC